MKKVFLYIALVIFMGTAGIQAQTLTKDAVLVGGDGDKITLGAPASVDAQKLLLPGTLGSTGSILYISGVVAGPIGSTAWLAPGSNGQVLTLAGGVPTWSSSPVLNYWDLTGNGHTVTDNTNNLLGTTTANPLRIITGSGGPNTRILISATGDVLVNGTAGTSNVRTTSLTSASAGNTGGVMFADASGYLQRLAAPAGNGLLRSTNAGVLSWFTPFGSIGLSMPSVFSVSGSPLTADGTISVSLATQVANTVFAGPATGPDAAPTFRSLVAADVSGIAWTLTGNGHTVTDNTNNLLGTTTSAPLRLITGGASNTRVLISATGDVLVNGTAGTPNVRTTSLTSASAGSTGGVMFADASGYLNRLAVPASSGQILTSTTGGVLSWTSSPTLNFWGLSGNAATTAGTNFLGTTDNVAFEIHVDEAGTATEGRRRVMRFEPNATSANIIGGFSSNGLGLGTTAVGVTISGGGRNTLGNRASDNYTFVGGGTFNRAGSNDATVTNAEFAVVVGGSANNASGSESFLGGGNGNTASGSQSSLVGGGGSTASGANSSIGGGGTNVASGQYSTIAGGSTNTASSVGSSVLGGTSNTAGGDYTSVAGGRGLTLSAAGSFGFLGNNSAGSNNATVTSANTAYLGNVDLWLFSNDNTARQMRFYESQSTNGAFPAAGTNYSSFQAGAQSADFNYTLPTTIPTAGQVLTASAVAAPAVTLSWTSPGSSSGWALTGNSGTTAGTNFIGTTDAIDWVVKTNSGGTGGERMRVDLEGQVGVGNIQPEVMMDIKGGLATRPGTVSLSSGTNNNVYIGDTSYVRINNTSGAATITGIGNGFNGKVLTVFNTSQYTLKFSHNSSSSMDSARILNLIGQGGDVVIQDSGLVEFRYDGVIDKWIITNIRGAISNTSTGAAYFARTTSDSTITTTAALAGISELTIAMQPNVVHSLDGVFYVKAAGSNPDVAFAFDVPSDFNLMKITVIGFGDGGTNTVEGSDIIQADATASEPIDVNGGTGANDGGFVMVHGILINGPTAGNLRVMWNRAAGSDNITLKAGSYLRLIPVGSN